MTEKEKEFLAFMENVRNLPPEAQLLKITKMANFIGLYCAGYSFETTEQEFRKFKTSFNFPPSTRIDGDKSHEP